MPLPTGPIPLVAYDEIIEVQWGNKVAQSLNNLTEMHDRVEWLPPSEIFATTSTTTWTSWFTVGGTGNEITVPDWADPTGHPDGHVTVHVFINGIRDIAPAGNSYQMRLLVGGVQGRVIRLSAPVGAGTAGAGPWFGAAWMDHFPAPPAGDREVQVEMMRLSGTGKWAIDGDADITIDLIFHQPIGIVT